ncbi:MAG: hypothetical protein PUE69_07285 [Ruminococcus sp.]|nr:hypothetical protein [Ruminococcus sp.]CDF00952.1 unknown [Ruminococcus sp. CAG:624]
MFKIAEELMAKIESVLTTKMPVVTTVNGVSLSMTCTLNCSNTCGGGCRGNCTATCHGSSR